MTTKTLMGAKYLLSLESMHSILKMAASDTVSATQILNDKILSKLKAALQVFWGVKRLK